ncbi:MAG: hypothetical protein ACR2LE_05450 [Nocardioidaceae bacterium]
MPGGARRRLISACLVGVLALAAGEACGGDPANLAADQLAGASGAGAGGAASTSSFISTPRFVRQRVFPGKVLVAYYGTAHTGALGVLGETAPPEMTRRLRAAAKPFGAATGKKPQIVYELIVSIADASPGSDGNYSHFIASSYVHEYVRAARRHNALLVLDLQPGRGRFLPQAKKYGWALRNPFVGLALDPEWHMGPGEVPGQTIGSVGAAEVNRVVRYVAGVTRRNQLPQKLFMMHQFRTDMVQHIERVRRPRPLAMVQHVDGFGSQQAKLDTYHAVARPKRFHLGFKLFYDEDSDLFTPREVTHIRPRVSFISYQ